MAQSFNRTPDAINAKAGGEAIAAQGPLVSFSTVFKDCEPHAFLQSLLNLIHERAVRVEAFFNAEVQLRGDEAAVLSCWLAYWADVKWQHSWVREHFEGLLGHEMAEQMANGCIALEEQGQNPLWPLIVYIHSCDARGQIQAERLDRDTFWPVMLLQATKGDARRVADLVQVACFYNTRTTLGGRTGLDRKERQRWEVFGALMETSPTLAQFFLPDHDPEAIRLSLWMFQIHVIRNGLAVFDGCAVHYGCTQGAKGRVH